MTPNELAVVPRPQGIAGSTRPGRILVQSLVPITIFPAGREAARQDRGMKGETPTDDARDSWRANSSGGRDSALSISVHEREEREHEHTCAHSATTSNSGANVEPPDGIIYPFINREKQTFQLTSKSAPSEIPWAVSKAAPGAASSAPISSVGPAGLPRQWALPGGLGDRQPSDSGHDRQAYHPK